MERAGGSAKKGVSAAGWVAKSSRGAGAGTAVGIGTGTGRDMGLGRGWRITGLKCAGQGLGLAGVGCSMCTAMMCCAGEAGLKGVFDPAQRRLAISRPSSAAPTSKARPNRSGREAARVGQGVLIGTARKCCLGCDLVASTLAQPAGLAAMPMSLTPAFRQVSMT